MPSLLELISENAKGIYDTLAEGKPGKYAEHVAGHANTTMKDNFPFLNLPIEKYAQGQHPTRQETNSMLDGFGMAGTTRTPMSDRFNVDFNRVAEVESKYKTPTAVQYFKEAGVTPWQYDDGSKMYLQMFGSDGVKFDHKRFNDLPVSDDMYTFRDFFTDPNVDLEYPGLMQGYGLRKIHGRGGNIQPDDRLINLGDDNSLGELISSSIHETDHAIQEASGLQYGNNPGIMGKIIRRRSVDDMNRYAQGLGDDVQAFKDVEGFPWVSENDMAANLAYRHTPGEVLASLAEQDAISSQATLDLVSPVKRWHGLMEGGK